MREKAVSAMHSMTGFGAGSAEFGSGRVFLELRALNHKHQDIRLRLPQELLEHASFLEQHARATLGRGRYDMSVRLDGATISTAQVDEGRLTELYESLCRIRDRIAPGTPVSLEGLLRVPDVITTRSPDPEGARSALQGAFEAARAELLAMRAAEGRILAADLGARLFRLRELCALLEAGSSDLVSQGRARLRERVQKLLEGTSARLSEERLEQEIALLADKSDITEELVRLGSHFEQFEPLLKSVEPVGRRLDFLLQEISREVNTAGAKSQHSKMAHLVVEMKSEVERLREQVQNVD